VSTSPRHRDGSRDHEILPAFEAPRRPRRLWWLWAVLMLVGTPVLSQTTADPQPISNDEEPITVVPKPSALDPKKLSLGELLFEDPRLSKDSTQACSSCHDMRTNGADSRRREAVGGSKLPLNTISVFNSALNFRLNWEGNYRTLESQAEAVLEAAGPMGGGVETIVRRLNNDPQMVHLFKEAYGRAPDRPALLDAIATYERSLLTPESRFDRWLTGEKSALSNEEIAGYQLFKSLGCVSCHQGANIGGNLFQRHGIFHPLASPTPEILRVPSLRNVATTAPYFHDGSAPTLDDAVRKMGSAQLNRDLSDEQVKAVVAYLHTLTGTYRGKPVVAPTP
jgi:cytochrome c peroxidase